MRETPWHERKLKKLAIRDWKELVEEWQSHLPAIAVPGAAPMHLVADLPQLQIELSKVAKDNLSDLSTPIIGVREAVLHDGIFLLHKAAHVLASAQVHIREGMCTWSISSAYHAAFFAMKAVMHFLGVSVVEYDSRMFLVDVWASPWKKRNKSQGRGRMSLINTKRIEQRHMWAFLQRLLEITVNTEEVWIESQVKSLVALDFTDFARHRNDIHYRTAWAGNDLHQCVVNPVFGTRPAGAADASCLDIGSDDFCVFLGIILLRMGYQMFQQIAVTSKEMQAELQLIATWLAQEHSSLYRVAVEPALS